MKKLLLIDLSDYFILDKKEYRPMSMIAMPLGLMSLATFLSKNLSNKIEIKIIKSGMDFFTENDVIQIINEGKPNYIGIRSFSINADELYSLCNKIKKNFPKTFLIVGGPHASTAPEEVLKKAPVDIIVIGEGEYTFLELISKLLERKDYSDVAGIVFNKNGRKIFTSKREPIVDLDNLPFPEYDLIDLEQYATKMNWALMKRKNALIESSRGCPFDCIFCHNLFGKRVRFRSADSIFNEIKKLYDKYNVDEFFFVDDAFNLDYNRAIKLFDKIIDSNIKIKIHFINGLRGDLLDQNFIDKMVSAGTISVAYAVETASKRLQKYIHKNINLEKLKKNIEYTCEKDIMVRLFFMFGFPTETEKEVEQTLSSMKQFKKCLPLFFAVKYYKNTKMYDLAIKEDFSKTELNKVGKGGYHQIEFCSTPLLSEIFMKKVLYRYLKEVLLNKERMKNIINIQRKYLSDNEIKNFYSEFFMKKINSVEHLISLCN